MLFIALLLFTTRIHAQITYADRVYQPAIKTVEFYNTAAEGSFPVITLGTNEQVLLSFDDLGSNAKNYNYTIEHCDAEWNPSRLSPVEYLDSFTEDRIMDYRNSIGTIQKYAHYEVTLPNRNIAPKIAGNYLLKVYENGNPNNLIITRRFYVAANRSAIFAELIPSQNVAARQSNQKINLQIDFNGFVVQNPYGDVRVVVMQNARSENAQLNARPTFIRGSSLLYNDIAINDFAGLNEYRHFDTRSLRLNSERVQRIFRDTANTVLLLTDYKRGDKNYLFEYDLDGGFSVRNQEGRDPRLDGDYAQVYFNLATPGASQNQSVYVVGRFNNWQLTPENKLDYDTTRGRYFYNTLLKQGIYDYQYVSVTDGKPDFTAFEGSYFETENNYQILVYYRPPGARWEELIGYRQINTSRR